ncbi:MAG: hypothetical protein P8Z42_10630 [Anaerolineales bacterium]
MGLDSAAKLALLNGFFVALGNGLFRVRIRYRAYRHCRDLEESGVHFFVVFLDEIVEILFAALNQIFKETHSGALFFDLFSTPRTLFAVEFLS